jgi:GntR family transcriptional regulator / MocR family aminotransferase
MHVLRTLPGTALLGPHRGGFAELRVALNDYIARARAVAADPAQLVVTAGLAQGLTLLAEVLAARGARRIGVEDPSWPHHARAVRLAGLECVPLRVDDRGLVTDGLAALGLDAVITTPAHQFPTGVALAPERRAELIAWAVHHGAIVIEDDYDAEYRYDREPVPALQGMAPNHVAHAGTVSKTLAPTLRMGWLSLPAHLADDVAQRGYASGAWPSIIDQAVLATVIHGGAFERHLRATRRRYRRRRDVLIDALADTFNIEIGGVAAGLHLLARPGEGVDVEMIATQAQKHGVAVDTMHRRCWIRSPASPALLMGYAASTESELRQAVSILGRLPAAAPMRRTSHPDAPSDL